MTDDTVPELNLQPTDEVTRLTRRYQTAKHLADGTWMLVATELCNPRENRLILDTLLHNATRATLTQSAISVELGRALTEGRES